MTPLIIFLASALGSSADPAGLEKKPYASPPPCTMTDAVHTSAQLTEFVEVRKGANLPYYDPLEKLATCLYRTFHLLESSQAL